MRCLTILLAAALALSGCAADPEPLEAVPVEVATVDGPFELTLLLSRSVFRADEPITGEMRLTVLDGVPRPIGGPGSGPLGTSFVEIHGTRRMEAAWRLSCGSFQVLPAKPIVGPLEKSGGWDANDANAPFYEAFCEAPDVRLPPGIWEVSARATFSQGECGGPSHEMTATARITVQP